MMTELLRALVSSFLGVLGFAVLVNAPKRSMLPAALIGTGAYVVYWALLQLGASEPAAVFVGAMTGSMAGLWCSGRMRMIGTVFLMMSIVSFVPGLGLYRCMEFLGNGQTGLGAEQGVAAMIDIAMIVLGQGLGSYLFRSLKRLLSAKQERNRQRTP
ncbi:MAG: threonine/serine exporter family protein [Clostridia bacterium]|nr:threonine/serine exporter family protein [Clostridia bacterium]